MAKENLAETWRLFTTGIEYPSITEAVPSSRKSELQGPPYFSSPSNWWGMLSQRGPDPLPMVMQFLSKKTLFNIFMREIMYSLILSKNFKFAYYKTKPIFWQCAFKCFIRRCCFSWVATVWHKHLQKYTSTLTLH